jgi:hypothetical protein
MQDEEEAEGSAKAVVYPWCSVSFVSFVSFVALASAACEC